MKMDVGGTESMNALCTNLTRSYWDHVYMKFILCKKTLLLLIQMEGEQRWETIASTPLYLRQIGIGVIILTQSIIHS